MTTTYEDTRSALLVYVKADELVNDEVGTRVFGDELPRDELDNMPRKAVVFHATGAPPPSWAVSGLPVEVQTYDVFYYGATAAETDSVRRAVHQALRNLRRYRTGAVLLHWARIQGGGQYLRDDRTDWHLRYETWEVFSDTREARVAGVFSTDFSTDFS